MSVKYLVAIGDSEYFHWQIEPLIKSFKNHKLENDLVIVKVAYDNKENQCSSLGFDEHEPKFILNINNGLENRYFSKSYAILGAIENKFIENEFVVIEPDMVLYKPIASSEFNVQFSTDYLYNQDYFKNCDLIKLDEILKAREIKNYNWPSLGAVMQFKNTPKEFFLKTIYWGNKIKASDDPRYDEKLAWILAFFEYYGLLTFNSFDFECNLLDFEPKGNFVHYSHGLPPEFHKSQFYTQRLSTTSHPYEGILNNNPNLTTDYLQKIIKSI